MNFRRRIPPRGSFGYLSTMLSAILLAFEAPRRPLRREAATRSLGALVEACVEGLVADAVLAGAPDHGLGAIAEEAGCALVEARDAEHGLRGALALARYSDVLLLLAGYAPERGFIEEVRDLFAFGDEARAATLRVAPNSLLTRLAPGFAAPVGLIACKAALRETSTADIAILAKKLKSADLTTRARRVV